MKKAVMYGAGNIGCGFIGKVFADSGYEVCFLDIDQKNIDAFNRFRRYDVRILSDDIDSREEVKNTYAVNANTNEAIDEIANCGIMATAVGVNVLPHIIGTIASGVKMRMSLNNGPMDIILAENQLDVDRIMRKMIYEKLDAKEQKWADNNLGLVEASIGRMVPPLTPAEKKDNPLLIAVEPYAELLVDALGFKGEIPKLIGLKPFTPFSFYTKRKLFLHNMGHAVCAYLGWQKGYKYISQAIRDGEINSVVDRAMSAVVKALDKEYPQISYDEINANKVDLLHRFRNKALKDTVSRVAGDPLRKLRVDDRLVGAALYCLEWDIEPDYIVTGIVAALKYKNSKDEKAVELQRKLDSSGLDAVLKDILSVDVNSHLGQMIKKKY